MNNILVKGDEVVFAIVDTKGRARKIRCPKRYGIIHDPDGQFIAKCTVYVGPFTYTGATGQPKGAARDYFGRSYNGRLIKIGPRPAPESFRPIGEIYRVWYVRRGKYKGWFQHPFERGVHPVLSKSGRWYRITLDDGNACIYNDRGFVFP